MKRYLCIYLPRWSVNLLEKDLHESGKLSSPPSGIILTSQLSNHLVVKRCCAFAEAHGIKEGMALPLAQALLPSVTHAPFTPKEDFKKLYKLGVWAIKFTPLVALEQEVVKGFTGEDTPSYFNGLILDTTGTEKLYSEEALAKRILTALSKSKIVASIASAPTIGSAWALSRYSNETFTTITSQELRERLSPLPVRALRISDELVTGLSDIGVKHIHELMGLPRKKLLSRFSSELLRRLDQAFGYESEVLSYLAPPHAFKAEKIFDPPLFTHATLCIVVLSLLKKVMEKLTLQKRSALSFVIHIEGIQSDRRPFALVKELSLNAITKSLLHAQSVIEPLFESLRVEGGIHRVIVTVKDTRRTEEEQEHLHDVGNPYTSPQSIEEFINSLVTRLGTTSVNQVKFHHSYIPEKSFSYHAIENDLRKKTTLRDIKEGLEWERPSHILTHPESVTALAMLPDRPPTRIIWRGKNYKIINARGPERIAEEWWKSLVGSECEERDYFKLQDDRGRWLWVFRNRFSHKWFVHGVWA